MDKKTTSFRLKPSVIKKLKYLSFETAKPIGDIIEALVEFSESGKYIDDEKQKERFNNLLELAFLNAGEDQGGFGTGHKDITIKPDGKADMKSLQEKIRKLEAEDNG